MTGNFISIAEDLRGYGTQPFEGPLDLLLYLIKQDEIDIYDIPIAKITHQYLAYLEAMKELDLEIAGEFILMASMLIRIKAQMLLPRPGDEQEEFDDPRSELVNALLEYKRFKLAADQLDKRGETWHKRYTRASHEDIVNPEVNYVLRKVDINALMVAFGDVILRAKKENFHQVEGEEIPIEDRIRHIINLLRDKEGAEFYELFADDPRLHVLIVTFMAILELAKLGQISIHQVSNLGKIWVYPVALNLQSAIKTYEEIT